MAGADAGYAGRNLAWNQNLSKTEYSGTTTWTCRGSYKAACGYRRNDYNEAYCAICGRHWSAKPTAGTGDSPVAKHGGAKSGVLAPWAKGASKGKEKEAGTPSPTTPLSTTSDSEGVDLGSLRKAYTALVAVLGTSAAECIALAERIDKEAELRKSKVPFHILLQKVEKSLHSVECKLQKEEGILDLSLIHI